jgi:hypothetical protein
MPKGVAIVAALTFLGAFCINISFSCVLVGGCGGHGQRLAADI